jgi:hypothetical protein
MGPGRVLVAVYGVFALSATARSVVQIADSFGTAPAAYTLSAVAAAVYLVATVALAGRGATARLVAWGAVSTELVGVVAVGTWTVLDPNLLADETVWSAYGAGYGYVPLVLPVLGLGWLWRTRRGGTEPAAGASDRT